jgi:hypothetical protein
MPRTSESIRLHEGLVWLRVLVQTARKTYRSFAFVLDPGSSQTILNRHTAEAIGFPESAKTGDATFDSVSGPVPAYTLTLPAIIALGRQLDNYEVAAKSFPSQLHVDGVLGLDFFVGTDLLLAFRTGKVELEW